MKTMLANVFRSAGDFGIEEVERPVAGVGEAANCVNATWTVSTLDVLPVYVVGSTPEMGGWNTSKALPLHGQRVGNHLYDWNIDLAVPCGQPIEFKFIQKADDGNVRWEAGENRVCDAVTPNGTTHWGTFR